MSSKKDEQMLAEYDFRGKKGERGKYFEALRGGYRTIVRQADGSTSVTETRLIALAPDVQRFFPDEESVNRALRELIESKPEMKKL